MVIIESDRTAAAIQTITADVIGHQVGVTQAGRLGNEVAFANLPAEDVRALRSALGGDGHRVYVTRSR